MEPSSPGARTRQRPQQLKRQEAYSSERAERFSSHEVPSPGRGDGKAGSVAVAGSDPETTLGRLLRRLPHEASCDGRAPITGRSTKPASGCTLELTTKGPLQKQRNGRAPRAGLPLDVNWGARGPTPVPIIEWRQYFLQRYVGTKNMGLQAFKRVRKSLQEKGIIYVTADSHVQLASGVV
jgi:hypothetical protein